MRPPRLFAVLRRLLLIAPTPAAEPPEPTMPNLPLVVHDSAPGEARMVRCRALVPITLVLRHRTLKLRAGAITLLSLATARHLEARHAVERSPETFGEHR